VGDPRPFSDFNEAATAVLEHLQARYPLMLWMVTRTEGEDWIVLGAADRGYGVGAGDVFRWTDTFCSRMVEQGAPRVAPCSADVPAYANAPIASEMEIGAYMGVPLHDATGELFGTLCAIDPHPQPPELAAGEAELEMLGRLLSTVLAREILSQELQREVERASVEAERDGLTGVGNRRFWEGMVASEELRCRRYGHPATVIVVDLDDLKGVNDASGHAAGDELLRRAAATMAAAVRPVDALARIGGDEFAVLAVECAAPEGEGLAARVHASLAAAGVAASVGWASRDPREGLPQAVRAADAGMYAHKQRGRDRT
jgi:diguanylate cyclase (GGDEF)-like protein